MKDDLGSVPLTFPSMWAQALESREGKTGNFYTLPHIHRSSVEMKLEETPGTYLLALSVTITSPLTLLFNWQMLDVKVRMGCLRSGKEYSQSQLYSFRPKITLVRKGSGEQNMCWSMKQNELFSKLNSHQSAGLCRRKVNQAKLKCHNL